jgi:hypothetical protein
MTEEKKKESKANVKDDDLVKRKKKSVSVNGC